jgi:hypothetical protein
MILKIIYEVEECYQAMEDCFVAGKEISRREDFYESQPLMTFLQQESNVKFTAHSVFTLEYCTLLKFFNSVVPFTVMFVTVLAEANRFTRDKSISNATST